MRHYIILILQLLCACLTVSAQQNRIDSLFQVTRTSTLLNEKINAVSEIQGYINATERSKTLLDSVYNLLNELSAEATLKKDTENLALVWLVKARYFHDNLELDSSIHYALNAEWFYSAHQDTAALNACYWSLWSSHRRLNHFNTALRYFFKWKEIMEQRQDTAGLISSYFSLGMMYVVKEEEPKKIVEAMRKPLQYGRPMESVSYCYVAEAFLMMQQPDSAAENLKLGASALQGEQVFRPPYYYRALAKYYRYTGQLDSAIVNFHKAIDWLDKAKQNHNQSRCYYYLGEIAVTRNELALAETYYRKAESVAKRFLTYELPGIYLALSKLYERQHRLSDAYHALKQYQLAEDSVKRTETTDILVANDLQHQFTLREGELKKEQLKKEFEKQALVRKQRQSNTIASVIVIFISVIALLIYRSRKIIFKEKKRSDELLLNILPAETAEELKSKGSADAKYFDQVTVIFTDFKNFSQASGKLSPAELVKEIHYCYSEFDKIISKHGLEKIKTIGDSYMCAGGLPVSNQTHAEDTVRAALEICRFMEEEKQKRSAQGIPFFEIRIGLHTGPVVAGIVGIKKFAYDIWGDTVNIASRMESGGEAGKVNISGATYRLVKDQFTCTHRGKISAKNMGEIDMYFVEDLRLRWKERQSLSGSFKRSQLVKPAKFSSAIKFL